MRWRGGLVWLLLAVFLGGLDQTVVAALLPSMVRDFAVPLTRLDQAAWAVTLYLAAYAAMLPLAGHALDHGAGDLVLLLCLGLFGLGSVGCALATDLPPLVAARTVQALGAGALVPVALAETAVGQAKRPLMALGTVFAVAEAGGVLGPAYGIAAVLLADWRAAFWLNVPVSAILALLALRRCWSGRATRWAGLVPPWRLVLAAGLLALGVAGTSREAARFAPWLPWATIALGSALGLGVAARSALGARVVPALLAQIALGVVVATPLVLVPVWASTLLARPPDQAALLLLPMTCAIPLAVLPGAWLGERVGRAVATVGGFALAAVALGLMSRWDATSAESQMLPALLLAGGGIGLMLVPTTALVLWPGSYAVSLLSWATAARVFGMGLGLATMTIWGLDQLNSRLATLPLPLPRPGETSADLAVRVEAYRRTAEAMGVEIFGTLFVVAAGAAVAGAMASLVAARINPPLVPKAEMGDPPPRVVLPRA